MFDIVSVELKVRYSKKTCILYLGSWISGVGARNPASMQLPDWITRSYKRLNNVKETSAISELTNKHPIGF